MALDAQARLAGLAQESLAALKSAMVSAAEVEEVHARTAAFAGTVRKAQESLREVLDQLEKDTAAELWPIPIYRKLLAPLI
jgi:glutamine synthetase type III